MIRYFLALAAGLILAPSTFAQLTFEFEGVERSYFMEAPDPIPEGAPLVFVLHGYSSSSTLIRAYSGWPAMAEQEGFVAVFPQGTTDQAGTSHWNANLGISTTNDHGFLVALAEHLQESYNLSACIFPLPIPLAGLMSPSLRAFM